MASLADLLRDKQFRADVGNNTRDFFQSASNTAASNVTAPVDVLAWLLRKAGVNVPQAPLGGSDWAQNAGLMAEPKNKNSLASLLGDAAGNIAPILGYAKAPEIAGGLNQLIKNANAPDTLNKGWHGQRGVLALGRDGIRKSADDFAKSVNDKGLAATIEHSSTPYGNSSYVKITDPITGGGFQNPFRFSDHPKGAHQGQFVNEVYDPALTREYAAIEELLKKRTPGVMAAHQSAQEAAQAQRLLDAKELIYSQSRPKNFEAFKQARDSGAEFTKYRAKP